MPPGRSKRAERTPKSSRKTRTKGLVISTTFDASVLPRLVKAREEVGQRTEQDIIRVATFDWLNRNGY